MKYQLLICARVDPRMSIKKKHEQFMKRWIETNSYWSPKLVSLPDAPEPGKDDVAATITLNKHMHKGIKAQVYYQYRRDSFPDLGKYDDHVDIEFDPEKVDYPALVNGFFESITFAFDGYLAGVREKHCIVSDWSDAQKPRGDRRQSVSRFWPLNFFDSELCQRAFGIAVQDLAAAFSNRIEEVKVVHNGIFLYGSKKVLTSPEINDLNAAMWTILRSLRNP